jgi:branched-chain amino acid transport system substrate-binding protein
MAAIPGQTVRLTQALAQARVTKGGGGKSMLIGPINLPCSVDQQAGPSAVGYIRGMQFDPMEKRKMVQDFVQIFKTIYGANETPTQIQAHAYDSILVVAEAMRRGATTSERMRTRAGIPTAAVGLIDDPVHAIVIVRENRADMVMPGRELLHDP